MKLMRFGTLVTLINLLASFAKTVGVNSDGHVQGRGLKSKSSKAGESDEKDKESKPEKKDKKDKETDANPDVMLDLFSESIAESLKKRAENADQQQGQDTTLFSQKIELLEDLTDPTFIANSTQKMCDMWRSITSDISSVKDRTDKFLGKFETISSVVVDSLQTIFDGVEKILGLGDELSSSITGADQGFSFVKVEDFCDTVTKIAEVVLKGSCGIGIETAIFFTTLAQNFVNRALATVATMISNVDALSLSCEDIAALWPTGSSTSNPIKGSCGFLPLVNIPLYSMDWVLQQITITLKSLIDSMKFYQLSVCPIITGTENILGTKQ